MRLLLSTFLFAFSLQLGAQNAPIILCANDTTNNWIGVSWINDHNCGGTFTATNIYQSSNPSGPFNLVGTVTDPLETNYVDQTAAGFVGELFYYVEHDCSGSTAVSDTLSSLDPLPPTLISVSVVNGDVEITWEPGDYPDSFGTIVYREINGGPTEIQSISGLGTTQTIDTNATPDMGSETYDLSTLDGCDNTGSVSGLEHSTMWLTVEGNPCLENEPLRFLWSGYVGWDVVSYNLLKNGVSVGTADPATIPHTADYFLDSSDVSQTCFVAEATNADGVTSLSNEICYDFSTPEIPAYIYMRRANVEAKDLVRVEWYIDETTQAASLLLNRGIDVPSINTHIDMGDLPYMAQMDTSDALVNTATRAYYYNISAADSCNAQEYSGNVRTILLKATDNFDLSNNLEWNAYEIENGTVTDYNIYRNDDNFSTPIATVGATTLTYTDVIGSDASAQDGFCYRVEAIYDLSLPIGDEFGLNSWSWEACVVQNSRIFVPNVFAPNGINKVFSPTILYPNYEDYRMVILNRWGEILFESKDPDIGWNGLHKGALAPQGVYAYVIKMKSLNGIPLERKGTVLLMR